MTAKIIDLGIYQALASMVGEDYIGEMVEAFLDEGAQFLKDLSKALDTHDTELFRRAAHSIKSNATTFGALALSELAEELETIAREDKLKKADVKLEPLSRAFTDASQALKKLKNE